MSSWYSICGFLPGLGRVAISCCSMVTSTKLGLFEVTWRMYGGSVAIVVILAIEVGNLLLGIDKKTISRQAISICLLMFSSQ